MRVRLRAQVPRTSGEDGSQQKKKLWGKKGMEDRCGGWETAKVYITYDDCIICYCGRGKKGMPDRCGGWETAGSLEQEIDEEGTQVCV